jgi:5'-3' exoribonuclease 2
MGVPVFFKWMCMRNPKILKDASEAAPDSFDSANPYIDNFYVDMNGLIHPACNPKEENIKVPNNFEEQCQNIYEYMDKIMNIVRPRKLVYLAIDGVAPRAKMNQQRTRRFRAAMEGLEMQGKKEELLETYKRKDLDVEEIEKYVKKVSFDSNVITPGTPFLDGVGQAIRNYIKERLATHRLWKNLTVVFSDASCPGEG